MPCNLFGPNDNYNLENSHFLPALIKKIYIASKKKKNKVVKLWGTGKPLREVLYVDQVANACEYFLRKKTNKSLINIGSNIEMTIKEYANLIRKKIDNSVSIKFDNNKKLDGIKRKKLNVSLATKYGWTSDMNFLNMLNKTIKDYIHLICKKLDYKDKIKFNNDKFFDGTPRKVLDCKIAKKYGWKSIWSLDKSINYTIEEFLKNKKKYLKM